MASGCLAGDATISVASMANLPSLANFTIGVATGGTIEWMLVTAIAGSGPYTLTVTRAQEGSTAAAHSSGDSVFLVLTGGALAKVLADHSAVGTYASAPTSTTGARKGMRYRCIDAPYEFIFDGAAWQQLTFSPLSYQQGSTASGSSGAIPTGWGNVDSMVISLPASSVSRIYSVSATLTFSGHVNRGGILLDGAVVFPHGSINGFATVNGGDGALILCCAGVQVIVPGDGATHTISLGWQASGTTAAVTLYDRWITALQLN
jgi:hypothetical protein